MARTQQYRETWKLPADSDLWVVLRAADSFVSARFDADDAYRHVRITDERGYVEGTELSAAHDDWKEESHPLKEVSVHYRQGSLWVSLWANFLNNNAKSVVPPTLDVSAEGEDAAQVRGLVLEAMERAQNAYHPVENAADESPTRTTRSRLASVMIHPWTVTVGGGVLVALIVALLALVL